MATSPHQPTRLQDRITDLKAELAEKKQARSQILALGQSNSGGGVSTTYPSYQRLDEEIKWIDRQIETLTAQLVGDPISQPGVNQQQYRADYV